jgi:serine/threonine protein kinase
VENVYVPYIVDGLTTKRIMALEWIDGINLSRSDDLRKRFNLKDIMTTVQSAFAHEIFVSGFVHGDPHPGNILVREHPDRKGKHQVCLIDFGLVVDCSERFRTEYCRLWKVRAGGGACRVWSFFVSFFFFVVLRHLGSSCTVLHFPPPPVSTPVTGNGAVRLH